MLITKGIVFQLLVIPDTQTNDIQFVLSSPNKTKYNCTSLFLFERWITSTALCVKRTPQ